MSHPVYFNNVPSKFSNILAVLMRSRVAAAIPGVAVASPRRGGIKMINPLFGSRCVAKQPRRARKEPVTFARTSRTRVQACGIRVSLSRSYRERNHETALGGEKGQSAHQRGQSRGFSGRRDRPRERYPRARLCLVLPGL